MRAHLDLKRMRYIVETARAEAITTAAETLSITQSAVSRAIAEVEDELGTKLFERLPRGIQLTDAGRRFVARARQILGDVDNLVSEVREVQGLISGRLRIGIAPTGYLGHVQHTFERFAGEHPGITMEVMTGTAQMLCPRLLHGEIDVMISPSSYLKRWHELEIRPLTLMHFAIVTRPGHPLADVANPTEVQVLGYPVIMPQSVEPMYSDLGQRYAQNGLPPVQPRYITDSFELSARFALRTDAILPVQHPSADFAGLGEHFHLIRDVVDMPTNYLSLAFSSLRARTAATDALEVMMLEEFGETANLEAVV